MECVLTSKLFACLIGLFNFGMSNSLQSETPFPEEPIPCQPWYTNTHRSFFPLLRATPFYPMSLEYQQDQSPFLSPCEYSLDLKQAFSLFFPLKYSLDTRWKGKVKWTCQATIEMKEAETFASKALAVSPRLQKLKHFSMSHRTKKSLLSLYEILLQNKEKKRRKGNRHQEAGWQSECLFVVKRRLFQ